MPRPTAIDVIEWTFPTEMGSEKRCTVMVPRPLPAGAKLPVVVALHGLGEAYDVATGASGWPKKYELEKTYLRLYDAPLTEAVFGGFVTPERLNEVNHALDAQPFRGVVVVCPYMPSNIGSATIPFELYGEWMARRLLPRVRSELPVSTAPSATGIDGISLGGWAALLIGLQRPDSFGAIGMLQPSIADSFMVERAVALISAKLEGRPLHLVTTKDDFFRVANTSLDQRLTAKGIAHDFVIGPGPHDYPWNRGAGGVEMLLWHDRVLRG